MRRESWKMLPRAAVCAIVVGVLAIRGAERVPAQAIQDVTFTPFVMGFRPVVNNGAVGGVLIDARGVVTRANTEAEGKLRAVRQKALAEIPADLNRASELRKVSLRGLELAITELRLKKLPITDEVQNLAGLQRVRYVFVDRERRDIVLAGPAEGWQAGPQGAIVGRKSGVATLQLDDLVLALRAAEGAREEAISCSIDPTAEGVRRFNTLAKGAGGVSDAALRRLEAAIGPQVITLRGIPADSHFARVMVAADVQMKRLAMGFQRSPVAGLPSYLDLIARAEDAAPRDAMPRWWLAPKYEPLLRDADGLAWEIRGPGVQALTEDTRFSGDGQAKRTGQANPVARKWAETFTSKYGELSAEVPVFAELRNCIDLAVVGAIVAKYDLAKQARYGMTLLMSKADLQAAAWDVPKTTASQANAVRKGSNWVITVSGGVEIDPWSVAEKTASDTQLAESARLTPIRQESVPKQRGRWWWD